LNILAKRLAGKFENLPAIRVFSIYGSRTSLSLWEKSMTL
jgi:hypothetical protein